MLRSDELEGLVAFSIDANNDETSSASKLGESAASMKFPSESEAIIEPASSRVWIFMAVQ